MRFFLCLPLILLSGCSTMATIAGGSDPSKLHCDPDYTIPRVYSGVANDIRFLGGNYSDKGIALLDVPFSLIADTVVLPYTIVTQTKYGNLCTTKEAQPE